jgi:transcriptional regulator with XRE-family HTH domain
MIACMDALRLGTVCRTLRIKKGWRQEDLAGRARVTRADVSRLERGLVGVLDVDLVVRIVAALGGRLGFSVFWQGGELDRLLNARHSALHESVAQFLLSIPGWVIAPEVSFAVRGERGVIDMLAWHSATRTLLVIELKTELVDLNELLGTMDRKRRLAPSVARDRGWLPARVAVWVVVGDSKTNRRRAHAHATMLRAAFPSDGRTVRGWLRVPAGDLACLSFWSDAHGTRTKSDFATVKRVRVTTRRAA